MGFKRLFSSDLSQVAQSADYSAIFGDKSLSASFPETSDLTSLSSEASQIVTFVRYKLGEPILTAQLDNQQIFAAFEESNIKYSSIVNTFQARSWMIQYYGMSNDFNNVDLTGKLPAPFSNFLKRITQNLTWEMNPPIGGSSKGVLRKAYIYLNPGQQDYDIYNDIIDTSQNSVSISATSISAKSIDLKTIYHYPASTLYRFYDPYSSINMMSQEFNFESFNVESIFYVMPIWADILRAQQLNMNDKVRRSNFSYERVGRRFRVFPTPKIHMKLWLDFCETEQNPFDNSSASAEADSISNFYQVPFSNIAYDKINAPGKWWIRNYTFALSMEMEGRIRRKFDKIPVPGDSITMDGAATVQEALSLQVELEKQLRDDLEKLTVKEVMKENTEIQQMAAEQNKQIPLFVYLYE